MQLFKKYDSHAKAALQVGKEQALCIYTICLGFSIIMAKRLGLEPFEVVMAALV